MAFEKISEKDSLYDHLEEQTIGELLREINNEDKKVPYAVENALPQIERLVTGIVERMHRGGRIFYIGAGTSGRLGVLDASEIPPTFGMDPSWVNGVIAGGDKALRSAVENAEDDTEQGWVDLQAYDLTPNDTIIGIAASGTTPYVIGALRHAREAGLLTGSITSNPGAPISQVAEVPIEVVVGPEFVTGSSRMKSGTAQKLVCNMITTTTMIRMGRVKGNKMVNMQLTNKKLVDRGTRMLMAEIPNLSYEQANRLLMLHGSVQKALTAVKG